MVTKAAPARLDEEGFWRVPVCPYCGDSHRHEATSREISGEKKPGYVMAGCNKIPQTFIYMPGYHLEAIKGD